MSPTNELFEGGTHIALLVEGQEIFRLAKVNNVFFNISARSEAFHITNEPGWSSQQPVHLIRDLSQKETHFDLQHWIHHCPPSPPHLVGCLARSSVSLIFKGIRCGHLGACARPAGQKVWLAEEATNCGGIRDFLPQHWWVQPSLADRQGRKSFIASVQDTGRKGSRWTHVKSGPGFHWPRRTLSPEQCGSTRNSTSPARARPVII